METAASAPSPSPSGPTTINPVTGLSTDYLNHFTEALMVLEMAGSAPECLDDLRAWRPKSYVEHFAQSHFAGRDAVIAAYRAADPAVRAALDAASDTLNALLARSRDAALGVSAPPGAETPTPYALPMLRRLVAQISAVINGGENGDAARRSRQAAIDAMFER
jgi:hypothetical protein